MNLLDRTYQLVESSTLKRSDIAKGAGVEFEWFKKFKQGVIVSPGVDKVQKVHDFLARKGEVARARR